MLFKEVAFAVNSSSSGTGNPLVTFLPLLILGGIIALIVYSVKSKKENRNLSESPNITSGYQICSHCGATISGKENFCPNCGKEFSSQVTAMRYEAIKPRKDKAVAAILGILLGGLGIHKFYLDKPIQGILYILFSWTFIPVLIGFIEGIIYAFMDYSTFEKIY